MLYFKTLLDAVPNNKPCRYCDMQTLFQSPLTLLTLLLSIPFLARKHKIDGTVASVNERTSHPLHNFLELEVNVIVKKFILNVVDYEQSYHETFFFF